MDRRLIKIRNSNLDHHLLLALPLTRPLISRKRLSDQLLVLEEGQLSHLLLIILSLEGSGRPSLKTNQLRQPLGLSLLRVNRVSL